MKKITKKIFISHAYKDKELVEIFVDYLLECGMGFTNNDIFCTSLEGMGIKTGEDWRNEIQKHLCETKVVILFITPNYKESEMCLNEMGAAWASNIKVIPIIVDPLSFNSIGILYEVKQSLKLTEDSDLDELMETLEEFNTSSTITSRWNAKKKEAISLIKNHISKNPFKTPLTRDELDKLQKELEEIKQAFNEIVEEKNKYYQLYNNLKQTKDLESVQKLEKDYGLLDEYEEFIKKAQEVGRLINNCSAPVQSIIYYKFTNQNMTLSSDNTRLYSQELKEACASQMIDEDEALNMEHPIIKKITISWLNLAKEFNHLKSESCERLEREYPNIAINLNSSDFWKEIMCVKHILF